MKENKIYNTALYCRLSLDDGNVGDSGSIQTQKIILEKYAKSHGFKIYEIYVDDGYSGLNFNRPGFQKMLQDIENGKINLVITKDLSRLGRNYIETGYYTEHYFKDNGVRYIAINDGIDTINDNNDIAPFKNILNDMYAKDLSRKVKSAKRQRALNGLFISAQVPYEYMKELTNKNNLVVNVKCEISLVFVKIKKKG
ncbi:MAG: recombinase family protein [Christensenellales bacterium]